MSLMMGSLDFQLYEKNALFCLHFWKMFSLAMEIVVVFCLFVFILSTLCIHFIQCNVVALSSDLSNLWQEVCCHSLYVLLEQCVFSFSGCFKVFFFLFYLLFSEIGYSVFWWGFPYVYTNWGLLRFWICRFILENLGLLFLQVFFLFSVLFWMLVTHI